MDKVISSLILKGIHDDDTDADISNNLMEAIESIHRWHDIYEEIQWAIESFLPQLRKSVLRGFEFEVHTYSKGLLENILESMESLDEEDYPASDVGVQEARHSDSYPHPDDSVDPQWMWSFPWFYASVA